MERERNGRRDDGGEEGRRKGGSEGQREGGGEKVHVISISLVGFVYNLMDTSHIT